MSREHPRDCSPTGLSKQDFPTVSGALQIFQDIPEGRLTGQLACRLLAAPVPGGAAPPPAPPSELRGIMTATWGWTNDGFLPWLSLHMYSAHVVRPCVACRLSRTVCHPIIRCAIMSQGRRTTETR